MKNFRTIITDMNINEEAIKKIPEHGKTLLITRKHTFVPDIYTLLEIKRIISDNNSVFVIETNDCVQAIQDNISEYKNFLIVGYILNNFENEFLRQISVRLDKLIIQYKKTSCNK